MSHVKKYAKYYAMVGVGYAAYRYLHDGKAFDAVASIKQAALWPGYVLGLTA